MPYLRRAVRGMPQNPEHHYHLGSALLEAAHREEGRQELQAAVRLKPDFAEAAQARALLGP